MFLAIMIYVFLLLQKQRRAESPTSSSGRTHGVSQVTRDIIRPSLAAAASSLSPIEKEMVASQKAEAAAGAEKVRVLETGVA